MIGHERIGTVTLLRTRIYALDAALDHDPVATEVVVEPSVYPLYRHADAVYWMMTGRVNGRGFDKIGDGLFVVSNGDEANGPDVTFPSRRFGPEQWAELLADPSCIEGYPEQRLRVTLDVAAAVQS